MNDQTCLVYPLRHDAHPITFK